jgi:hypothetical protein
MVDGYTKAVLTVIAACLVWNIVGGSALVRPVSAQSGPVHVIVDSIGAYVATLPLAVRVQQ